MNPEESEFRSGYVAIIGRPNVGKSTLLNQFLDLRLSIVTPRPQTTRNQILGIKNTKEAQLLFLDTPGMIKPRYELHKAMMRAVRYSIESADVLLFMVDATSRKDLDFVTETIKKELAENRIPKILVINKIDLVPKSHLLPLIEDYHRLQFFKSIIPVSALKSDGLEQLESAIIADLPVGVPFYPPDIISEQPERFFVAEIIREQIFILYREEIPYSTQVHIEQFTEKEDGKDFIRAVIYVERESQKAILIGKKGANLKKVGEQARRRIEEFLGRPVFLELWVKVREKWRREAKWLKHFGYE